MAGSEDAGAAQAARCACSYVEARPQACMHAKVVLMHHTARTRGVCLLLPLLLHASLFMHAHLGPKVGDLFGLQVVRAVLVVLRATQGHARSEDGGAAQCAARQVWCEAAAAVACLAWSRMLRQGSSQLLVRTGLCVCTTATQLARLSSGHTAYVATPT